MHLENIECRLEGYQVMFKILLAEGYLLYMSTKQTWRGNQEKNWGTSIAHLGPP